MDTINFNNLPENVQQIKNQLNRLEELLNEILKAKEKRTTWFSISEVAEYLHLAVPTIYSMTSRRQIPFAKRNKKLYFLKESIDSWLNSGRKRTVPDNDF